MSFSKDLHWIDPRSVIIAEGRQRRSELKLEDLVDSIRERGVINPIIITRELVLVAGERRTRASIEAGLNMIPYRLDGDLSPLERRIVELEENERRQDLHWMDRARAIGELHALYTEKARGDGVPWSASKSAEAMFYTQSYISEALRVFRDIASPRVANAPTMRAAYNILGKIDERAIGDAMSAISGAAPFVGKPKEHPDVQKTEVKTQSTQDGENAEGERNSEKTKAAPSDQESILNVDFITWAAAYRGPRFNFIHCDFPYGVNLFNGPQGGRDKWADKYDDDPDVYWRLIRAFCEHRDNFMAQSANMMFWLSADIEIMHETLEAFAKWAPELRFQGKPLIWHKSDNIGILSDPRRGARHIYETCLIASRDDRPICQATSDVYACKTDKAHHPSTKPESMLRYYFQMFVDEHTELLDPTCGSGAALRAAESMPNGRAAKRVLGLELDAEHCTNARSALRQARAKAAAAERLKAKT